MQKKRSVPACKAAVKLHFIVSRRTADPPPPPRKALRRWKSSIAELDQGNFCIKRQFNKLINMCYLSTLARFFFLNTNNLLKNADFLVYGKSAEFSRVGDFHTFYQIGLENKKFSEKFCNFQKEFRVFQTNFQRFS